MGFERSFIFDSDKVNNFKMPINEKNCIIRYIKKDTSKAFLPTLLLHVFFTVWWCFIGQASHFMELFDMCLKGFDFGKKLYLKIN